MILRTQIIYYFTEEYTYNEEKKFQPEPYVASVQYGAARYSYHCDDYNVGYRMYEQP